jgi:hypothetical protein
MSPYEPNRQPRAGFVFLCLFREISTASTAANRRKHGARSLERRSKNNEWRNEKSSLNAVAHGLVCASRREEIALS